MTGENTPWDCREPPLIEREATTTTKVVQDYPRIKGTKDVLKLFRTESKRLWGIAGPIVFNMICLYAINSTTNIFVGHLGNLQLSAVGVSLSVISNFSFGFLLGMGSALETLCGQAFGAGQVHMLGIYLQRSWIILIASSTLLCPLYIFSGPFLKLLGQEDEIADLAGKFTISIIPQMFALAISFPNEKFLQAQSKVMVIAWIGFGVLLVHIGMLFLFIFAFKWGLGGAAAAYNISFWLVAIAQVIYVTHWCKEGWNGLSWSAFRDLWAFVRLSLASAVMICLEVWYMMIVVLMVGHLQDAQIAVGSISICLNMDTWEFMVFVGLNAAISVRVSNELGSGRPRAAKYAVIVVVVESIMIGLLCMAIILATRNYFSIIFTNDKDLQRAVADIAYLLGITMLLNSVHPVIAGVAVGSGWQSSVAFINLVCYYIFGIPFGFILGYLRRKGVQGIWGGMLCGSMVQTLILLFIVWRTDWKAEAAKASRRLEFWSGQTEMTDRETEMANLQT